MTTLLQSGRQNTLNFSYYGGRFVPISAFGLFFLRQKPMPIDS
jgi:hypothetical protein